MKKRTPPTVYLDNAATTYPKPREVINEALRVIKQDCGNPGRSSHRVAMRAAETVFECRRRIASHFGGSEENVIFTSSATHSLNLAIKTALRRGDHVLISDIEHNSVIRPISALAERGLITLERNDGRVKLCLVPLQGKVDLFSCPYLQWLQSETR